MRRIAAFASTGILLLTLTGCPGGGDGGDESAFCDDLEELAGQIRDGDLDNRSGLEDVKDTVNALLEDAPSGDPLEAVQEVRDAIREDNQRGDELLETMIDALEDHAEDCDIDDFGEVDVPETTQTTEAPDTTDTTGGVDTTDTTDTTVPPEDIVAAEVLVGGRDQVPAGTAPEFAELAQNCFNGLARACDDLFLQTPVDSVEEEYGRTCGGRITEEEGIVLDCVELLFASPDQVPAGIIDTANAQACRDGNMVACDDLFLGADPNTEDRRYGALCGDRVLNTDAFCVDIFGDTSVVG